MRESAIEKAICEHARATGWRVYKFTSPAHRAVPDRIFINPNGVTCYLELKAQGQKPTPLQEREINLIKAQGAPCAWTDSVHNGKVWLDNLRNLKLPTFS